MTATVSNELLRRMRERSRPTEFYEESRDTALAMCPVLSAILWTFVALLVIGIAVWIAPSVVTFTA